MTHLESVESFGLLHPAEFAALLSLTTPQSLDAEWCKSR